MSEPLQFTGKVPIIGKKVPLARLIIGEDGEYLDLVDPPSDASPEQRFAVCALCGMALFAKATKSQAAADSLREAAVAYRDKYVPIILGD